MYKYTGITSWDIENFKNGDLETLFQNGLLNFNFQSRNSKNKRYPKYTLNRFIRNVDLKLKDSSNYNIGVPNNILSQGLNFVLGFFNKNKSINFEINRRKLETEKKFFCSELEDCSPWPMKQKPFSVKTSQTSLHEGKIYVSLEVYYSNESSKRLAIQESKLEFAYYPHPFFAVGCVLFPPVGTNEIWSIGFIQNLETKESNGKMYYGRIELVVLIKVLF